MSFKPNSPRDDIARLLAEHAKIMGTLSRLHSQAEELLDQAYCTSAELQKQLGTAPIQGGLPTQPSTSRAHVPNEDEDRILRDQGRQGAIVVHIKAEAGGDVLLEIDGRRAVPLPGLLASLLSILIADDEPAKAVPDKLVRWKPVAEICAALGKSTGKKFQRHTVSALVYRLKQRLSRYGENKYLVHSHRELGHRFGLRRGQDPVTTRDHR